MDSNSYDWDLPDYYSVLAIKPTATAAEIRHAYHKRIREFHPDLNPESQTANDALRHIIRAGETLCNAERREMYNQYLSYHLQVPRLRFDPTGQYGYDVEYEITISAEDAQNGTIHYLTFHNRFGELSSVPVAIPAGVREHRRICILPGRGGPSRTGDHFGDLYVRIHIDTQTTSTRERNARARAQWSWRQLLRGLWR